MTGTTLSNANVQQNTTEDEQKISTKTHRDAEKFGKSEQGTKLRDFPKSQESEPKAKRSRTEENSAENGNLNTAKKSEEIEKKYGNINEENNLDDDNEIARIGAENHVQNSNQKENLTNIGHQESREQSLKSCSDSILQAKMTPNWLPNFKVDYFSVKRNIKEVKAGKIPHATIQKKDAHNQSDSYTKICVVFEGYETEFDTKHVECDFCGKFFAENGGHLKRHRESTCRITKKNHLEQIEGSSEKDYENQVSINSPQSESRNSEKPGSSDSPTHKSLGLTYQDMSLKGYLKLMRGVLQAIDSTELKKTKVKIESEIQKLEENGDERVTLKDINDGIADQVQNLLSHCLL